MAHSQNVNCTTRTPSKPKSKKRVRFSDPGPEIEHHDAASSSTGLTPMVRRSSLGTTPSTKRRRQSAPLRGSNTDDKDELSSGSNQTNSANNEVHFLSLRQVLDDRVKRRIRRNGLSEEMNTITHSKKRRAQEQGEELQRLRDELADKDQEIERLQNTTMAQDTDRIAELEHEVEALRSELQDRSIAEADQIHNYDWTLAARDPFSDSYMDDDGFGDATMADLVCSTPSKARSSARDSFPTPPCTSPTLPATPCSHRKAVAPVTPQSHVGVQASFPDPEKEALEEELGSLRLELTKLTDTLDAHSALKTRISDQLSAAGTSEPADSMDVEAHLDTVLQSLSDRTAALLDLNSSLSSLGFPGNDAGEMIASLAAAFRSARLELEYLSPGEIALPLSSRGAEVLDLVLTRLRDLSRRAREDEDAIDEYHALELSLRQQLGARVDAMDSVNGALRRSQSQLREKDERISDLEVGVDRLKGAAEGYRRDIAELEGLVQRVEDEGRATEAQLQTEVDTRQAQLSDSGAAVAELEAKLDSVLAQTEALKAQLADLQAGRAAETKALNRSHGRALALRDARVAELRREVDAINGGLRGAHETIRRLRVENSGLDRRAEEEKRRAKEAVDSMKAELERVVRMSSEFLATPKKAAVAAAAVAPAAASQGVASRTRSSVGKEGHASALSAKAVGKGRKKRRYDSGLGFLDEDEDEVDMV